MTKTQNPKPVLVIETGDPPAGWGVRRTISNKEFRTAEVIERKKKMSLTSIFCGSLFCGSAVLRFIFLRARILYSPSRCTRMAIQVKLPVGGTPKKTRS